MIHCDNNELVIAGTRSEIAIDFVEILHELITEDLVRIGGDNLEIDSGIRLNGGTLGDEVVTYSKRWR